MSALLLILACSGSSPEATGGSTTTASPGTTTPTSTTTSGTPGGTPSGTTTSTGSTSTGTPTTSGPFVLDLPLDDQAATEAAVVALGGSVTGGSFGPDGWTTTTRDDLILIPLPAGVDASTGTLAITVSNFEWELTTLYWEAWILLSLDEQGPPYAPTDTGDAGVQTLYQGFNPDDATKGYRPVGYFNLADPACADWADCTAEAKTNPFWLSDDGTTYTITQSWTGPTDALTFDGNGVVNKAIDLSATSPGGAISAGQLYLMINACGGSSANTCGPWGGPADLKGGPIGVTYADLHLELPYP